MPADVERIDGEIPAGGMRVPLFHDPTTDTEHTLHVLWADSLRWQGFKRALETPDRPTFPTRRSAARSPGDSRSRASTRPAGRPDAGERRGSQTRLGSLTPKGQKKISEFGGERGRAKCR